MTDEKPDHEAAISEAVEGMATVFDYLQVLAEQAKGYREYLEANGWSPTMAEQLAGQYLALLTMNAMNGASA